MTHLVLTFNKAATAALGVNTRLRIKTLSKGGVEYVGLRPSYRVSGKNSMLRADLNDDKLAIVELAEETIASMSLPQLKGANHQYEFKAIDNYGWFVLAELNGDATDATSIVTVSKRKGKAAKTAEATGTEPTAAEVTTVQGEPEATVTLAAVSEETAEKVGLIDHQDGDEPPAGTPVIDQPDSQAAQAPETAEGQATESSTSTESPDSTGAAEQTSNAAAETGSDAPSEAAANTPSEGGNWPFKTTAADLDKKPKGKGKASAKPAKTTPEADPQQEANG